MNSRSELIQMKEKKKKKYQSENTSYLGEDAWVSRKKKGSHSDLKILTSLQKGSYSWRNMFPVTFFPLIVAPLRDQFIWETNLFLLELFT